MEPEVLRLDANGWIPNNGRLPVLVFRRAVDSSVSDPAAAFEVLFDRNGWPPQWRDGIFPYHHYHPAAHEVLGIARGQVAVLLGGPDGVKVEARAGDVVVLPAGTGHCRLSASADLLVVGAYGPGQDWRSVCADTPAGPVGRPEDVPFPASDPVCGPEGPLLSLWR